ncbi:hypothetical protein IZ6_13470 [Terrihabitans soli]|uniref:Uncharacterized protein n=1 Tax=Terrihabitans soli TaxID=708113 RepID=A0A6S6QTL9_9HYPH|nr:hypothetical protein IZ6_13470 [Terrihabitans soli]
MAAPMPREAPVTMAVFEVVMDEFLRMLVPETWGGGTLKKGAGALAAPAIDSNQNALTVGRTTISLTSTPSGCSTA